jgi:glycerol-3-phosphate acyltransferase PlsX
MKFALDAMGGDLAPSSVIQGALDALQSSSRPIKIILIGDETVIRKELGNKQSDAIEIVHTDQFVTMEDKFSSVLKAKTNSSLVR